jgi:choline dehydrogenase
VRGVEIAREIVSQAPFDTHRGEEIKPGPGATSSQDLETYLRENVELLYHPVGTCRMGSGEGAVVDRDLSVRGVEGLRVADASVMPKVVSGNTNAPTMMIAARAADFILSQ